MRRTTVAIALLSAAMEESQQALAQALAVTHASGLPHPSQASVVQAAHAAWPAGEPFEKDGYRWVGRLGLRFHEAGEVIAAVAGTREAIPSVQQLASSAMRSPVLEMARLALAA